LNVFELRRKLVEDYGEYATSFVHLADSRVRGHVDEELKGGLLWPEPLIQLNPAFESGGTVDALVGRGLLHPECERIFRAKSQLPDGQVEDRGPLRLHKHQTDAIEAANAGANYVLTTGTGSGKSLTYIVPIVDRVLRSGTGQGIKAIIVYPMNALANSQIGELGKYINLGYPDRKGPVTFARYTGQESDEDRLAIMANPPDILITNYVMMELILTRPIEKKLTSAAKGLKLLVFDEVHTYRGRQGADVALLARRMRNACGVEDVQHIGTSATMASTTGTLDEQREEVASVASQLFGARVEPEHVIGETLRRATSSIDVTDLDFKARLRDRLASTTARATDYASFIADPLSAWIEDAIGLTTDSTTGRLIRRKPRAINGPDGAAAELGAIADISAEAAGDAIQEQLLAGYRIGDPETGFRVFAFRLHQFISRGETVYATIEEPPERYLTTEAQRYVPDDRSKILFPLAFCRECGQDYYPVWLNDTADGRTVTERDLFEAQSDRGVTSGFIFVDGEGELVVLGPGGGRQAPPRRLARGARRRHPGQEGCREEPPQVHPGAAGGQGGRGRARCLVRPGAVPLLPAMRRGLHGPPAVRLRQACDARVRWAEHRDDDPVAVRGARPARRRVPGSEGAEAAQLHRQPTRRVLAGRPLQRLRADQPPALRPLHRSERGG
jgi:hypothetical protein